MVESHDELIMEIADEIGLNRMGEYEDEDDDDEGDVAAPRAAAPSPILARPIAACEVIIVKDENPMEIFLEQQGPVLHQVILADVEPEPPQPRLYRTLIRDYEESPSRMMDDLHELDDLTEANNDVDKWYPEDGSNDRD
jgi:hypothetical protein